MPDSATKKLDGQILSFMRRFGDRPAGDGDFTRLALKVFAHQFRRNEAYRRLCLSEAAASARIRSWKKIPAMPASGFKELVVAAFPMKRAVKVFQTSGTTGGTASAAGAAAVPKGAHFFDTLRLYRASLRGPFRRSLLPEGGRMPMFFLMPSPGEAPHSSLSFMMGEVRRLFSSGPGRFYIRKGRPLYAELARDLGRQKRPVVLLSTAFALKGFLDALRARKRKLRLPPGSRLMETGGFKGRVRSVSKKRLYAGCERRLGIPAEACVSEYGMTELSSQFYADAGGIFRGPAWIRTLVIDPRTGTEARSGRPGLLRHFDLANRGSVLAVQTEDMGRAVRGGFEWLGRAPGADLRGCSLTYEELLSAP